VDRAAQPGLTRTVKDRGTDLNQSRYWEKLLKTLVSSDAVLCEQTARPAR
jgi:hypothetical protein